MDIVRIAVLTILLWSDFSSASAQRTISEGTILYDITIQPKSKGTLSTAGLSGAKSTIYLKGGLSRTEMTSTLGTETTIYNSKIGNAVILKEYSGQKLMITLTKENWESSNKKFDGITYQLIAESKTLDGYNCKKAFAKLQDGSTISVYYTPELIAINKEYNQAFATLPGFPMEYEFETENLIIKYQLSKIDYSPLASSKFDFPKTGYRIMTYDENKAAKGANF
jgi:GLPGLI family protein